MTDSVIPIIIPAQVQLTSAIQRANAALPTEDSEFLGKFLYNEGYRPMEPVSVDDPDELDRYPVGTVVRLAGASLPDPQVWQRVSKTSYCWSAIGMDGRYTSETVLGTVRYPGTALVIHTP